MTTAGFVDFYQLLHVPPEATEKMIEAALRQHLRLWTKRQADTNKDRRTEAKKRVRHLNAARKLLDADERLAYDDRLRNYRAPETTFDISGVDDWGQRAQELLAEGRLLEAHQAARRATGDPRANDIAWYLCGHASFLMGNLQDAETELKNAIAGMSSVATYHFDLGDVHALQERWADAERAYTRASELSPNSPQYKTALAYVYCAVHQPAKAAGIMQEIVEEHPDDELFLYYQAIVASDLVLENVSHVRGQHALRSWDEITRVDRHVRWLEGLAITNADATLTTAYLRGLLAEANRRHWIRGDYLWRYIVAVLGLIGFAVLIGSPTWTALGFLGAVLVSAVYLSGHIKRTWQLPDDAAEKQRAA